MKQIRLRTPCLGFFYFVVSGLDGCEFADVVKNHPQPECVAMPTKGADQVSDWSVCIGLCVEVKGTLDWAVLHVYVSWYMYL